jgi:iron complex transport system substrate-binding protein
MLDEGDMITSCSNGLKRDKLILSMEPSINDIYLPKVGGVVNIEELLNSDPDIILIDAPLFWNKGEIEKIENLNIPYYVVEFNSIDEEKKLVEDIGKIIGREAAAKEYVAFYDEILALVEETVATIPYDERRNIYHSINEAVRTSASNTITSEWVEKSGLNNVAADNSLTKDEDKYYTTLEDILKWNPEVIIANDSGAYKYIKENVAWKNMEAVLNDDVYLLPTGISRWGHSTSLETPLAMLWALKTLYPEYSKSIDLKSYTKIFYEELFEYNLTDEELESILSGVDMRKAKNLED